MNAWQPRSDLIIDRDTQHAKRANQVPLGIDSVRDAIEIVRPFDHGHVQHELVLAAEDGQVQIVAELRSRSGLPNANTSSPCRQAVRKEPTAFTRG